MLLQIIVSPSVLQEILCVQNFKEADIQSEVCAVHKHVINFGKAQNMIVDCMFIFFAYISALQSIDHSIFKVDFFHYNLY